MRDAKNVPPGAGEDCSDDVEKRIAANGRIPVSPYDFSFSLVHARIIVAEWGACRPPRRLIAFQPGPGFR